MWILGIIALLVIFVVLSKKSKFISIIWLIGICVLLMGGIGSIVIRQLKEPIGQISGPEMDFITIDGCVYEANYNNDFSSNDRERYIGKVVTADEEFSFNVYSVKGTDEYIYRLWDWEGAFYKKVTEQ